MPSPHGTWFMEHRSMSELVNAEQSAAGIGMETLILLS
jgi:hypothetical protein